MRERERAGVDERSRLPRCVLHRRSTKGPFFSADHSLWYRSEKPFFVRRSLASRNQSRASLEFDPPSWLKPVKALRLLSGAGEEGLIRAGGPISARTDSLKMSAITMSAAAVRPVVARANVARRYVPRANVARGAAHRFRRRASHRDRDRNARVQFSRRRERGARGPIGTGSARTS